MGCLASCLAQRRGTTEVHVKSLCIYAISRHALTLFFGFSLGEKLLWELI